MGGGKRSGARSANDGVGRRGEFPDRRSTEDNGEKKVGEWSDGAVFHGARFDEGTSVILEEIFLPARFG